jgi:tRNA pseudouridine13 synthase
MDVGNFKFAGRIKKDPEDFIVEEVWDGCLCSIDHPSETTFSPSGEVGDYLHFTLVKRNWDTVKALRYIAKGLRVSLKRFGIAGMKDKRAITAQRASIWRVRAEEMMKITLPDILMKDFSYAKERINLGDARGNRFTITIRDIPLSKDEVVASLAAFKTHLLGGRIPNYFGSQRIGGNDDNVEIGRAIVAGRLEEATSILLRKVEPYVRGGRIDDIPDIFWIERMVINHLRGRPNDHAGALRKIPKKILRIFPHAMQSKIFNERLRQAILMGDVPEYMEVEGFEVKTMPELRTRTIQRKSHLEVMDFGVLETGDGMAKIRFMLGSGQYATTLLAELLDGV